VRLRERHEQGDGTESFAYQVILPKVTAQRARDNRWMLVITHTDGGTHVLLYLDTAADAKLQARRLAQRYATTEHYSVEEDVKLARAFAEELQAARQAPADDWMTHACASCGCPLSDRPGPEGWPYAYCRTCQDTRRCPHGVLYKDDCNGCNVQSDFAYDAWRERR
jgi:hypothetical protein